MLHIYITFLPIARFNFSNLFPERILFADEDAALLVSRPATFFRPVIPAKAGIQELGPVYAIAALDDQLKMNKAPKHYIEFLDRGRSGESL
jgi:hypothetical protein